jgi:putative flippase GtrA
MTEADLPIADAPILSAAPAQRWRAPAGARLLRLFHEGWKYFLVSVAALAIDYGLLMGLTAAAHVHYLVSAAAGFCAGLAVNYGLSVTLVFSDRRVADRRLEFLGFLLIGLVGLGLNELLMRFFVETGGLNYALAKVPATGLGFVFNFGVRKALLFSHSSSVPS